METLKELIETLEMAPRDALVRTGQGGAPGAFCSWRGVYQDLSLEPWEGDGTETVGGLLTRARAQVGAFHTGWKGGEFQMGLDSRLWADMDGSAAGRRYGGITMRNGLVVLSVLDEQ